MKIVFEKEGAGQKGYLDQISDFPTNFNSILCLGNSGCASEYLKGIVLFKNHQIT